MSFWIAALVLLITMRKYAKVDSNQSQIVEAFRSMGCAVQSIATVGNGVPDLLVARRGNLVLVEVKDGKKPPSHRRLTEDEQRWQKNWKSPVYLVQSVDDAASLVNTSL